MNTIARAAFLLASPFVFLALFSAGVSAEPYPADAGAINVKDYGARGDGINDDTGALRAAIAASGADTGLAFWQDRIVYLPAGTYLVSDTLLKRYADGRFASGLILIGEHRDRTKIRLMDSAPGFADPKQRKAVVFTTSKLLDSPAGRNYVGLGEGNDAYMNFVEDLTIDVGQGNPGAVALDFLGNNLDAIRNVTLYAGPGSGAVGLLMTRRWPGPTLVQNLIVNGFEIGIETAQTEYGVTFDTIQLLNQTKFALRNTHNALAIRKLTAAGPSPIISNSGEKGFLAIDGALVQFHGPRRDLNTIVDNVGIARLRGFSVTFTQAGAEQMINGLDGVLTGTKWRPSPSNPQRPIALDSPSPPQIALSEWINATHFGAVPDPSVDSTEGLRRAFATGAAVIYLPHGTYSISSTLLVPATVRRIVGMHSALQIHPARRRFFAHSNPFLRIASGRERLFIDRLTFDHTDQGLRTAVEHRSERELVLRDIVGAGTMLLDRKSEGGVAFIENTCCGRFQFAGSAPIYARQLNTEGGGTRIINTGSPLWILGLKTEGITTVIDNRAGARTEIFGGLIYMVRENTGADVSAFINTDSWLSVMIVEESLRPASRYATFLTQRSGPNDSKRTAQDFPARGFGRFLPDLVATPD